MAKNTPQSITVDQVLASIDDPQTVADAKTLLAIMQRITGCEPKIWNVATIGFDSYHYKYDSGREGDCHVLGFYPRKDKLTIYLMASTDIFAPLLSKLGAFKSSKSCLYIKRLSDVDLRVLEQILQESYTYIKQLYGSK